MKNLLYRLAADPDVKDRREFSHVFGVVLDPFLEILSVRAGPADLPEAGNAGPDRKAGVPPVGAE